MKKAKVSFNLDTLKVDSFVTELKKGQDSALLGGKKKKFADDGADTTG